YTAATCDPNEFTQQYQLRAQKYNRKIKLAIVITMYNEDDVLFCKTFTAVMKNIAYLCSGSRPGWGPDDWKSVLVCIVSDGRAKISPLVLNVMSVLGIYMDGLAKASVNGQDVKAHIFEFTSQITVREDLSIRLPDDHAKDGLSLLPCQVVFLLKEKNAKKINSHRWFFKAVCDSVEPDVCILIDVGTRPTKESFFHVYRAFERDPHVGGACGEIKVELGRYWNKVLNPIVAVQNFEYKMSNILDKPLESVFGYISVLPGAFSAYRYAALQGEPLKCYFAGESPNGRDVTKANMYLAEDRILCFEICMKENEKWLLKYVKSASAETDVPSDLTDLIKQRRRWLNGAFFVQVHSVLNWMRIFRSGHSTPRKWILLAEFVYNTVNLIFSWFNVANFYLAFYFLFNFSSDTATAACNGGTVDNDGDPFHPHGGTVFGVLTAIYTGSVIAMIVAAMGNRPEAAKTLYHTIAIIFALIMALMLFMAVWSIRLSIIAYNNTNPNGVKGFFSYAKETPAFRDMCVSVLSTYGLYIFSSILHLDPWHLITCLAQYVLMIPSFVNVIMIYAFCNLHDVSWGTKGITAASELKPVVAKATNDSGQKVVTVDLPSSGDEANKVWEMHRNALMKESENLDKRKEDEGTKTVDDDFFKQFRTNTILLWFITNGLLVYIFTNPVVVRKLFPKSTSQQGAVNPYITFLLWSIAVLSAIRFFFSFLYLIGWWSDSLEDGGKRNPVAGVVKKVRDTAGE
ncbi:Chitin synthase, class 2, partial [Blyttiomyces sp. JEL0837]